jgi:hypothetical protein
VVLVMRPTSGRLWWPESVSSIPAASARKGYCERGMIEAVFRPTAGPHGSSASPNPKVLGR